MEPKIQSIIDNIISDYTDNNEMMGGSDRPFIDEVNHSIQAIATDTSIPNFDDRLDKIDDYIRDLYAELCDTHGSQDLKIRFVHELIQAIYEYITTENKNLSQSSEEIDPSQESTWTVARNFFKQTENQQAFKLSKKQGLTEHSFIKMNDDLFELSKVIGQGAFGRVKLSKAEEKTAEQTVVKVIQSQADNFAEQLDEQKLIDNEILALKKLGEFKGQAVREAHDNKPRKYYLASKKHPGISLLELLGTAVLTEEQRLEIAYLCAQQLNQAHQKGMLHLDVKPDNIIVDLTSNNISVKFIDWGTSEHLNEGDQTVTVVPKGTPGYMAPELLMSQASTASDVFSLGMMFAKDLELPELAANLVQYDANDRSTLDEVLRRKASSNEQTMPKSLQNGHDPISRIIRLLNEVATEQMSELYDTMPEDEALLVPLYSNVAKMQQLMRDVKALAASPVLPAQKLEDIKSAIDNYQRNASGFLAIPAKKMRQIEGLAAGHETNTSRSSSLENDKPAVMDPNPELLRQFSTHKLQSLSVKHSESLERRRLRNEIREKHKAEMARLKKDLLEYPQPLTDRYAFLAHPKKVSDRDIEKDLTILYRMRDVANKHRNYAREMMNKVLKMEIEDDLETLNKYLKTKNR